MHKEGRRIILFVGRLVRRKGVDDLLKAFAIVRRGSPESLLVIVGDGDQRENLVGMAGELGISDHVEFKGTLTGQAPQDEYEGSDMVVLPSKSDPSDPATEGLGLTLIEASMHRKPIVGTLHGGIPEIVTHLENGLLVPAGDPEALATAIATLVTDEDFARKLGQEALNRAQSRFSWTAATSRLLTTYSHRVEA